MKKKLIAALVAFPFLASAQSVGIGTNKPLEKLHVVGNLKADTVKTDVIKLTPNAAAGKILTSDGEGNAVWQENIAEKLLSKGYGSWGDYVTNLNISGYQPVTEADPVVGDNFGYSVSISGDFALIGVPYDDIAGKNDQGSANFYRFDGSSWQFMQKVFEPNGKALDGFGVNVFIAGNYAIIGAANGDGATADQGIAMIYEYDGTSWAARSKLSEPGGSKGMAFGGSVSLSGNFAIVGAPGDTIGSNATQGSAFIYQKNGNNWVLQQKITDPNGDTGDTFGGTVSISGNMAIVGVVHDDVNGIKNQGSAMIFKNNGGIWIPFPKIISLDGAYEDRFGAVSISGNYAVVGAYLAYVNGIPWYGFANVYHYDGSNWVFVQKLIRDDGAEDDLTGQRVCISGDYIIIGSHGDQVGANTYQGSATIWVRVGLAWQKLQNVSDPAGNKNDELGIVSAIDGAAKRFIISSRKYAGNSGKAIFGKIN